MGIPIPISGSVRFLISLASFDAILRDHQNNVIDRTPLPVSVYIFAKTKQLAESNTVRPRGPRARRRVSVQPRGKYCTSHLNYLLISDIVYCTPGMSINPMASPVNTTAQESLHVDNGTTRDLLNSRMGMHPGDIQQTGISSLFFTPFLTSFGLRKQR